jgi:hypothetical protein
LVIIISKAQQASHKRCLFSLLRQRHETKGNSKGIFFGELIAQMQLKLGIMLINDGRPKIRFVVVDISNTSDSSSEINVGLGVYDSLRHKVIRIRCGRRG